MGTRWIHGQPNKGNTENCLLTEYNSFSWHDFPCSRKANFICKKEVNQCEGKPDGTSCTTKCKRNENCNTACIYGVCEEVDIWKPDYCIGKIDGTSCSQSCRATFCGPPHTKCKNNACIREEVNQCEGKPDGTSCTTKCKRNENCNTACIYGVCEEVDIWKPDYCSGKIDGTSCSQSCR